MILYKTLPRSWRQVGRYAYRIIIVMLLLYIDTPEMRADAQITQTRTAYDDGDFFPIGVWDDGNIITTTELFEAMIEDLKPRGLDTVLFTNNSVSRHAPLLDVSDRLGFNVIFAPTGELNDRWWPDTVPADADTARRVIEPLVDRIAGHPSLKGYLIADEPLLKLREKVKLAVDTIRARDPQRPAMPVLIGLERGEVIFADSQPGVMLIDVYPVAWGNAHCNFSMAGFGYPELDFVDYVRELASVKPESVPLWIILQTHRWGDGRSGSLREPTVEEVRLQTWLAVGEGAKGLFWFTYSSQQGWRGLTDNPPVYEEVTSLARRIVPLRRTLLDLRRTSDLFQVSGPDNAYVSTLERSDASATYAVVANRNCDRPERFTISAGNRRGALRDLEAGQIFPLGTPIEIAPGDGRIFEFVSDQAPSS